MPNLFTDSTLLASIRVASVASICAPVPTLASVIALLNIMPMVTPTPATPPAPPPPALVPSVVLSEARTVRSSPAVIIAFVPIEAKVDWFETPSTSVRSPPDSVSAKVVASSSYWAAYNWFDLAEVLRPSCVSLSPALRSWVASPSAAAIILPLSSSR